MVGARRSGPAFSGTWCFAALLFLLLAAAGVHAASARRRSKQSPEDLAFTRHLMRVHQFRCSIPQPRALPSLDVIEEADAGMTPSEMIFPTMTVLHRCDAGSGCCMQGSGYRCGPVSQKEVQLDFKLVDHSTSNARHVTVIAKNHTECACLERPPK